MADFGAGVGHHAILLAKQVGEAGIVYAVEIQKDLLTTLHNQAKKEGLENVHPILGDIETPGGSTLADHSVDRVLIINTLFQLEQKSECLQEAKRILKSDGKVALIDWKDSFSHLGPHPDQVITKEKALSLVKEAGFELEKEFEAGDHHYGMLFRPL